MSQITKPVVTDETAQKIVEKLHTQNLLLDVIAGTRLERTENLDEIARIVRSGHAKEVFDIGDQIIVPWTDQETGKTYDMVWDVVHIADEVELEDGEKVPGMYIQAHYAHPFGVQFSQFQAINYFEEGLAAGTYYVTVGAKWGKVDAGTKINFTLTQPVPAGGQIAGLRQLPDVETNTLKISTYATPTAANPIETVSVSVGQAGTSLGELLPANDGALNLHRVAYGNNRYRDSAIRQYLNSAAAIGDWWNPQNNYDRPPDHLAQKAGFLSGFNQDFLDIIRPTKVQVAANTVSDGGATDVMYDKFFLPSLEQMYIAPQEAGVEGEFFEYWKRASGAKEPLATGGTYPQMRTFALENHASPQYVRLRSANRGIAANTWYVNSSGYVTNYGAYAAYRFAQVGVIC